ncbi:MAG: transcriptional regulator, LacI family [Clostridia bacterium]|jgi:LacI family transcriptional regulator|nr:transcriptional regulator, LacI family [Clostridia bacterium]
MTIKEISELAGVSQSTVSLVLNNKVGVGEETRKLVMGIAAKYGYSKKAVPTKKSILFIKYIDNGAAIEQNGDFVARIIDAIELAASSSAYNLIMKNIQAVDLESEIREILFEDFAGVIWLATEISIKHVHLLSSIPIPVVAVDNMLEHYDVDSVVMDNHGGIFEVAKYLYELGHREIGYIDSTVRFSNFDQRTQGYHIALEQLGILKDDHYIKTVQPTLEGAYNDMLRQLEEEKRLPTAFVAANDTIAIGAIKALRQKGIEIPSQISVVGFDDIPFCMMLDRSLTTMRVNKEKLGELAVKLLDSKINDPSDECIKIVIRPKLIKRESVDVPNFLFLDNAYG